MARSLTTDQLAILSALRANSQKMYGLGIISFIERRTGKKIHHGSLYNMLKSLEQNNLIKGLWGEASEERRGNRRRYYEITEAGLVVCNEQREIFIELWTPAKV